MERFDGNAIETMLRELRPAPRPKFVAELDGRTAAGFTHGDSRARRALNRLRAMPPRRILVPAAVSAVAVVAIATAVVSTAGEESAHSIRANISEAVQSPPGRQEP